VSRVLTVLTAVALSAATLAFYARLALLDANHFADRATAALQAPDVRDLLADRITDEVVLRRKADLLTARPLISDAISRAIGSDAFGSLFRRGVLDAHRAVLSRDRDTVTLTLADVGVVAAEAVRAADPKLADELRASGKIDVLEERLGGATGDIARAAERLRVLAALLVLVALACAAGAVALSADRRRTVNRLGLGAVVAGLAVVAVTIVARSVVIDQFAGTVHRAAAGAVWDAYFGDLRKLGLLLAACGAIVAAAAASLIRLVDLRAPLRAAGRWIVEEPRTPRAVALRAVALIVVGALLVLYPSAVLQLATTLTGAFLVYAGAAALLALINQPDARRPALKPRRLLVPLVAAGLLVVVNAVFFAGGGVSVSAPRLAAGCNGSQKLCDRGLDQIAMVATHNSMSAGPGWFSSQQDGDIAEQLEAGVRGLLIDTHYGDRLPNGRVRTYFSTPEDFSAAINQDGLSRQSVEAAQRLRDRAGFTGEGERGMYLCHTFCELGATPLADALRDIHDFLVTHPSAVVVVINQDYVTPGDFVGALQKAGLADYAFTPGDRWPPLREMIDADRRLVVLAENHAGAAPWYQPVYQRLVQETVFSFRTPAALLDASESCKPNRGPADAPLFLLNHWVTTDPAPRPSNAAIVNAYDALLGRIRACERIRGRRVNLVAIDFYRRGDAFRVVDTLNE